MSVNQIKDVHRLPQNKVDQIISFIGTFLSRRSIRKRELVQLLGHFNLLQELLYPAEVLSHIWVFFVDSRILLFLKIMVKIAIVLYPDVSAV
jgi:hypothetical protein